MVMMFGGLRRATDSPRAGSACARSRLRQGRRRCTLIATSRLSTGSPARNTSPIAPWPSVPMIVVLANTLGEQCGRGSSPRRLRAPPFRLDYDGCSDLPRTEAFLAYPQALSRPPGLPRRRSTTASSALVTPRCGRSSAGVDRKRQTRVLADSPTQFAVAVQGDEGSIARRPTCRGLAERHSRPDLDIKKKKDDILEALSARKFRAGSASRCRRVRAGCRGPGGWALGEPRQVAARDAAFVALHRDRDDVERVREHASLPLHVDAAELSGTSGDEARKRS